MQTRLYPTSFTDAQWAIIEPYMPAAKRRGRPRLHSYRAIINGIFYLLRTGCTWDMMPNDLPPWATCQHYFSLWKRNGTWQKMHDALHEKLRVKEGRQPHASAAAIDSQTVKSAKKGGLKDRTLLVMMRASISLDASDTFSLTLRDCC